MNERKTNIRAIGDNVNRSYAQQGKKTRTEMIAYYRQYHKQQLLESQQALAIPDEDLIVETYIGRYRSNLVEVTE